MCLPCLENTSTHLPFYSTNVWEWKCVYHTMSVIQYKQLGKAYHDIPSWHDLSSRIHSSCHNVREDTKSPPLGVSTPRLVGFGTKQMAITEHKAASSCMIVGLLAVYSYGVHLPLLPTCFLTGSDSVWGEPPWDNTEVGCAGGLNVKTPVTDKTTWLNRAGGRKTGRSSKTCHVATLHASRRPEKNHVRCKQSDPDGVGDEKHIGK